MDGLKGLCEQTVEDETCIAIRCELNHCMAELNRIKDKYSELIADFDRCKQESETIKAYNEQIKTELAHMREEEMEYSKINHDLYNQTEQLKKDNAKLFAEIDQRRIAAENIALRGQLEAYRFCIENLKR